MECAIEANIPIHILNTFKPESGGTVVDPTPNHEVGYPSAEGPVLQLTYACMHASVGLTSQG